MLFSFKFSTCLALLAALIVETHAHTSLGFPRPRSHPLNPNARNIDFECIMAPLTGAPGGCGRTAFPCKGYPRDSRITQTLRAGQLIDVEFFNQNFPNGPRPGDENKDQARHSGGLCQFSLSVDGRNFFVIAEYTRGCPDIFFKFPVRIPNDIPSSDSAIFAWTWINATGNREFYMNCADVKLIGVPGGRLTGSDIRKANLPGVFNDVFTPPMDVSSPSNSKGPGPSQAEIRKNSAPKGSVTSPLISPPVNSPKNSVQSPVVQKPDIEDPVKEVPDEEKPDEEKPDEEPADEEPVDEEPVDEEPADEKPFIEEPAEDPIYEEPEESLEETPFGDDFETPFETPIETPDFVAQSAPNRKCKSNH